MVWNRRSLLQPGITFLVAKIRRILGLRIVMDWIRRRWWGITNITENYILTNSVTFFLGNFGANFLRHIVAVLLWELLTFFP